jgi:hypothetical protein
MSKSQLRDETRLRVLEMASEIAGKASQNTNVVWMIEFQEELVERLYRKMIALMEEDASTNDRDGDDENGKSEDGQETDKKAKKRKK